MYHFDDLMLSPEADETAAQFVRTRSGPRAPTRARRLPCRPTEYPIGSKRILIDINYLSTYGSRATSRYISLKEGAIECHHTAGVRTGRREYDLDCLIFAMGFDALTGALLNVDIRGVGGLRLSDKWREGPRNIWGWRRPISPTCSW